MNRRSLLTSALVVLAAQRLPPPAWGGATGSAWRRGTSVFGDLKYPAGFKQFDYVNAAAPKGGTARQIALGTYDNFNMVVDGVKGTLAIGVDLNYDTLLVPALDEVSSGYGLLAEALSYPDDFSFASFRLRPESKWHDGTAVSAEDVIFSFDTFKKLSPQAGANYQHVVKAAKTGKSEVTFTFDGPGNRSRPQVLGQLVILPKAWWEGTDKEGKKRDPGSTTLEPPLGSGPCRIKEFTPGRSIVYERVKDYWGQAVSVNVGRDNFDELRFEYFRDITVAMEAFKVDAVDWRIENSAKNWATAYDFPAVADKRVVLEEFPIKNVGMMQAFAFNLRRQKFQDPRVRLAFNYAFDFEDMNNELFFGQYRRIDLDDEQIVGAINALVRRDTALAKRVIVADDRVDALQLEIEEKAATTIARRQPMAVDLREILGALRIANDLERIGDLAENIAKRMMLMTEARSEIKEEQPKADVTSRETLPLLRDQKNRLPN